MRTNLNTEEINYVRKGKIIQAIKHHKDRCALVLSEAKNAVDEVCYALSMGETVVSNAVQPKPVTEKSDDGDLGRCKCGGNSKIATQNKHQKTYLQVRCNKCGRRGAVYSYPQKESEQGKQLGDTWKAEETKALFAAAADWESMIQGN